VSGGAGVVRISLRYLRFSLSRWRALVAVALTLLLEVALNVLKPWPLKVLIDNVLGDDPLPSSLRGVFSALPGSASQDALLLWTLAALVAIFVLAWAVDLAGRAANIAFGQALVYDLAGRLFQHLQRLSLAFHARHGAGGLIRRITTDTESIATIVANGLLPAAASVFALAAMFLVMWQLDGTLTLVALAALPVIALAIRLYSKPMADRSYAQDAAEADMYDTVERTLSALPVVHAFGREEDNDRRFEQNTDEVVRRSLASLAVEFRFKLLAGLATAAGTAAVFWIGATHALEGAVTVGTIIVFLAYLASLYGPVEDLMATSTTLQEAAGSARRVTEILEAEPEVAERRHARRLRRAQGHVRFERVSFSYAPGAAPALHEIELESQPGQRLALVGPTGAGKTTLVSLVPRFFDPTEGRVTLDGHDLRDLQLRSLREQVAIVLQESVLFPRSIGENIAYGRPQASRREIEQAARAANAHDFIGALPQRYETPVGERGATLSGGERQRIAIARALLRDAPILILDEPTSALDAETEAGLLEALERLMAGRTTFVVAHRLSTVRGADCIHVLEQGRLVESGTHAELVARGGRYADFERLQSLSVVEAGG
jgi:ATP-binding cassette subfamily B protein